MLRVNSAQFDPYQPIHPTFQRLAGVRDIEFRGNLKRDPFEQSLRPETLIDLGSVYRGAPEGIADFVTEQVSAAARICADADRQGQLQAPLVEQLSQLELARRWIISQPGVGVPSQAVEKHRAAMWSPRVDSYIERARVFAFHDALDRPSTDRNFVDGLITTVAPVMSWTTDGMPRFGIPPSSSTAVGAAVISEQPAGSAMLMPQNSGIAAAMPWSQAVVPQRSERRASDYDVGRLKETLGAVRRTKKPGWIVLGTQAQKLYDQATELYADFVGQVWAIGRTRPEKRPSAAGVNGFGQQAVAVIQQVDRSDDFASLNRAVDNLRRLRDGIKTIIDVSRTS